MPSDALDPARLLAGPRGRRLCLELALQSDESVRLAVFHAAYDLDPGAGTSKVMLTSPGTVSNPPTVTPEDVAEALSRTPPPSLDGDTLLHALETTVSMARYWQQPDGEDVLADTQQVAGALTILARSVAESPSAQWWTTGLDRSVQCRVVWIDDDHPPPPPDPDPGEALANWRQDALAEEKTAAHDRPVDPTAPWSGVWWSTPPSVIPRTSRHLDRLGPVGLLLVEDSLGWERAHVTPIAVPDEARILEIDGPQTWAQLCRRHPLVVTASRRHDWYRTTGRTDTAWVQPDWAAVAAEVDGVHLTVLGYLSTAGRAIPVSPGTASVLAGWDPDATYWLTNAPASAGPTREWTYHRDSERWTEAK